MRMRCALPVANILYLLYSTGRNQQWNHWPNSYLVFTSLRKYKEWLYWSLWKQIRMAEQYVAPWQECFCMQYVRHSITIFSTLCVLRFTSPLRLPSQGQQASHARKEDPRRGTLSHLTLPVCTRKTMDQSIRPRTRTAGRAWSLSSLSHWSVLSPRKPTATYPTDLNELSCWWHNTFLLRGRHLRKGKIRLSNSSVTLQGDFTDWWSMATTGRSQGRCLLAQGHSSLQLYGHLGTHSQHLASPESYTEKAEPGERAPGAESSQVTAVP